eukprot:1156850-Pelagomonas_calceolata.AAC.19
MAKCMNMELTNLTNLHMKEAFEGSSGLPDVCVSDKCGLVRHYRCGMTDVCVCASVPDLVWLAPLSSLTVLDMQRSYI